MSNDHPQNSDNAPDASLSDHQNQQEETTQSRNVPQNQQNQQPQSQNTQRQNQQNRQNQQTQQGPQRTGGNQDIRNAQWLTLSQEETIVWWGHPSLIPHLPVILTSLLATIVGIASVFMFPDTIGYTGLIFVPIGLIGAGMDYARVVTTFYVVTDDKVVRKHGIIRRDTIEMRYENIEHVNARQRIIERLVGFGDIDLATAGTAGNEATLDDVRQPRTVSQTINQQKDNAYNQLRHKQNN